MAREIRRLIIGLGNPGKKYVYTRHNIGFYLIDQLANYYKIAFQAKSRFYAESTIVRIGNINCYLLKPQTFMNQSGKSVQSFCHYYKIKNNEILIIHDELDLHPGIIRLKYKGGHGGHNGVRDIQRVIGQEFMRLRIGIGHPGNKKKVANYVLQEIPSKEQDQIQCAINNGLEIISLFIQGKINKYNINY